MKKEALLCYEKGINMDFEKKMVNEVAIALLYSEGKKYDDAMVFFNLCKKDKPEIIYQNSEVYKYYQECAVALGLQI